MKTKGIVVVDTRTPIQSLTDFVSRIFPHGVRRQSNARKILELLATKPLPATDYREVSESLGISQAEYYKIMRKLRSVGLVYKKGGHHGGEWVLSRRFSTVLRGYADWWDEYVRYAKGGV